MAGTERRGNSLAEIDSIWSPPSGRDPEVQRFRIERHPPVIRFDAQDGEVEIENPPATTRANVARLGQAASV